MRWRLTEVDTEREREVETEVDTEREREVET